jgi:hypothetical protein
MRNFARSIVLGACAGGLATVAMSAVMKMAERLGLMGKQPPEEITESALAAADVEPANAPTKALAVVAHLGFGGLAGALYGCAQWVRPPRFPVARGIGFGLLVWTVSYRGWVPALRIMPPPERDRPGRPESMVAAHVVYGAALGRILGRRRVGR